MEAIRPAVDRSILALLAVHHFRRGDFREARDGTCQLLPPLTHDLADLLPVWASALAPHAEHVARTIARAADGKVALRTPLSQANVKAARARGAARRQPPAATQFLPSCRTCGTRLYANRRQLCSTCWPVHRKALSEQNLATNRAARQAARAAGTDPLQTPDARARRRESLLRMKAAEAAWREAHQAHQA